MYIFLGTTKTYPQESSLSWSELDLKKKQVSKVRKKFKTLLSID